MRDLRPRTLIYGRIKPCLKSGHQAHHGEAVLVQERATRAWLLSSGESVLTVGLEGRLDVNDMANGQNLEPLIMSRST